MFVTGQDAARRKELAQQALKGPLVCCPAHDDPHLDRLATDDLEHGRAVSYVPRPGRLFPHRRGGSLGSGWTSLCFPRVLIDLIGLELLTFHQVHRRHLVGMVLEPLAQDQGFLIERSQFLGQLRRTHPLRNAP